MFFKDLPGVFLRWRIRNLSSGNFTLLLSALVGVLAGLAAGLLKELVHTVQFLLRYRLHAEWGFFLDYLYPTAGILLTVWVARYLLRDRPGHGVTDVLYDISKRSSLISPLRTYSRMITSAITVGFGGSVGLEAPIVVTGSAIGSNLARWFRLDYKARTVLIGCGAAGAIAGIFNSPVAGMIFSGEVILAGLGFASFIPLLIAAVAGSLVSLILLGDDTLFKFVLRDPFAAADVPYYVILGVLCGLTSVYFTRVNYFVEARMAKIRSPWLKAIRGGLALTIILFIFPPLFGEGYDTIKTLLDSEGQEIIYQSFFSLNYNNALVFGLFLLGIVIAKPFATSLTLASGGSGGVFAPALFLGGVTGFLFAFSFNMFVPGLYCSPSNFALVGMCGVMSGVLHAPLTAIFLIAEITNGYTLFVPLMLVSAISFSTISYFEKYSIYTKHLIERGDYSPHDKDKQLLGAISVQKVVERDLFTIGPDQKLEDLVELIKSSHRNIFPVVDGEKQLHGIVTLDDVRDIMFDEDMRRRVAVSSLMNEAPALVSMNDSMQTVMNKFERTGAWNLPVLEDGLYVGFVSKSRIFNAYRSRLQWDRAD